MDRSYKRILERRKKTIALNLSNNLIFKIDKLSEKRYDGNRSRTVENMLEEYLQETIGHIK